jgi:MoaA/NifB/PqqE/SkfB family radical SAM enzyme
MMEFSPLRKKARLLKAYLSGHPIWVCWQVTYACNFRCAFCSYWKEEVNFSPEARGREATVEDFRGGAEKLGRLGSLMINLSGGEPFLRCDFAEIIAAVARQHFPMATTNGSFIDEQSARAVWEAGLWGISVSLDFSDAGAHDRNRGVRGAAAQARRAVQILSQARTRPYQRVNLLCVLNERNLGQVEELIRFAAANDSSFLIQPYASIKNGNQSFVPQYEVWGYLQQLKRRYRNFLSNPYFLARFDRFYAERGIAECKAGRAFFNIDNFLNIQKCVEFRPESVGNLRELEPDEMLRRLREEHRHNYCKACWYNCRGEVESLYSVRGLMASLPLLFASSTARNFSPRGPRELR